MIITRCLSTKYSLLLFWHYFFPVFPVLAVVAQCTPAIVLNSPAHLAAGLPRHRCPMHGSHIVDSCARLELCSVLPISISELSLAGLCQLCLLRLLFWHLGSCHIGICLRLSTPFFFGKPGSSSSGFLSVSRFSSRKVVLGRYRIPVLRIVVSEIPIQ